MKSRGPLASPPIPGGGRIRVHSVIGAILAGAVAVLMVASPLAGAIGGSSHRSGSLAQPGGASGGAWRQVFFHGGAIPPPRFGAALAYTGSGAFLLFGGCGRICPLNDTWSYSAGTWTNLTPTLHPAPPPRYYAAAATGSNGTVLFGGLGAAGPLRDTWLFHHGMWSSWGSSTSRAPSPRFEAGLDFYGSKGKYFLFGGTNGSAFFNDLWSFSGASGWKHLLVPAAPPARAALVLQVGGRSNFNMVFGGRNATTVFNDTWVYNGTGWSRGPTLGPDPTFGAGSAFVPSHVFVILFGGSDGSAVSSETWRFNGLAGVHLWYHLHPRPHPLPREYPAFAMGGSFALLVGGLSASGTTLGDTWEYTPP